MNVFEIICIVIFLTGLFLSLIEEVKIKADIMQLRNDIEDLAQCRCGYDDFNEKAVPEFQLWQLQRRAQMLKFCYQCPLYQDKVQEDKLQNPAQERPKPTILC